MNCCKLGEQINWNYRVLFKTDEFTITPAKGQIGIEGHLLLIHNFHTLGIRTLSNESVLLLENLVFKISNILRKKYSKDILIFEHGPNLMNSSGGKSLDHTHLHLVPFKSNYLLDLIQTDLGCGKIIKSYSEIKNIFSSSSYLFVENNFNKYLWEIKDNKLPSQYMRQNIAYLLGNSFWDWRRNPDWKTFRKTLRNLRKDFIYL